MQVQREAEANQEGQLACHPRPDLPLPSSAGLSSVTTLRAGWRALGQRFACRAQLSPPGQISLPEPPTEAAESPPGGVYFDIVSVGGSGCLPGTTAVSFHNGRSSAINRCRCRCEIPVNA
jgi:hypothetical protein